MYQGITLAASIWGMLICSVQYNLSLDIDEGADVP